MKPLRSDKDRFNLGCAGLLLGFFLGAVIVYVVSQRVDFDRIPFLFSSGKQRLAISSPRHDGQGRIASSSAYLRPARPEQPISTREVPLRPTQRMDRSGPMDKLDSLIGKTLHAGSGQDVLLVEFYEATVSQAGYIMTPGRLSLFGISEPEMAGISLVEGRVYLYYMDSFHELSMTGDFLPIRPISNPKIISDIQAKWK